MLLLCVMCFYCAYFHCQLSIQFIIQIQWIFDHGETPEFTGKAVCALLSDSNVAKRNGSIVITTDVGDQFKFKDIDGEVVAYRNKYVCRHEHLCFFLLHSGFPLSAYLSELFYTIHWISELPKVKNGQKTENCYQGLPMQCTLKLFLFFFF